MVWIIPLMLLILSVLTALVVVARKIPQLSVMDVEAMPGQKVKKLKERIILEKFARVRSEKTGKALKWLGVLGTALSKTGRRIVQRLYKLEQYYQKIKQAPMGGQPSVNPEAIQRLLAEAEECMRQEEYIQAEKRYIEVISHKPKYVSAYEGLGTVYLKSKQYPQARETLLFALRLDPTSAALHMNMADLEMKEGNAKAAVEHARKAVDIRPKNPKYLDAYVEAGINAKLPTDVERGLNLLREVNPENQKIEDFQHQLDELKGMESS